MSRDEERAPRGRFTEWFRDRPTSLEFWEVLVDEDRLVWCFAGESFSSQLLRADMGERPRDRLSALTPEEALAGHERNFAVDLADLRAIRLRTGTRTRRARLTVEWRGDGGADGEEADHCWTLSNTSRGDEQRAFVESLAEEPGFEHVTVEVTTPPLPFL
jgi:hypothetical protein